MTSCFIASIPDREESLRKTVESIRPQVDKVFVALNGYDHKPSFLSDDEFVILDNSRSDGAKFYHTEYRDGYVLTLDDDLIIQDSSYVAKLKSKVDQYRGACSYHGKLYPRPVVNLKRAIGVFRCLGTVDTDTAVDVLGTGCLCYHTDHIKVRYDDFPVGGMADVWFSRLCWLQHVPLWVIAHKTGDIGYTPPKTTIWQTSGRCEYPTKVLNTFLK